jgi:hypothetical protein
VVEVTTGRVRFELDPRFDAEGAAFSPDGHLLAVWDDETVLVYDLRTGTLVRRLRAAERFDDITAVVFHPDGKRLAVGNDEGGVSVWDVGTGNPTLAFSGHVGAVTGLAFSRDGARLLSTSADGTALLWDMTAKLAPKDGAAVKDAAEALRLLGSADPAEAQKGMAYLFRHPDDGVKVIGATIAPPAATPPERQAELVADLDSEDFATREAAAKALEALGGEAAAVLRPAEKSSSAEVRKAASALLAKIDAPPSRPEDLRIVRAVEVLERIGSPVARQVLGRWAAGPTGHRLTTEAAAALERLRGLAPHGR